MMLPMSAAAATTQETATQIASPASGTDATATTSPSATGGQSGSTPAEKAVEGTKAETRDSFLGGEKPVVETKDKPASEAKPDDKAQAEKTVELEIKLPEGIKIDEADLQQFKTVASEVKLSSEQASKLAAWEADRMQKLANAQAEVKQKQDREWAKAIRADEELGGENLKRTQADINKALVKFGGKEAAKISATFTDLGIDNHPEIARLVARVGRALAEDSSDIGAGSTGVKTPLSRDERQQKFFDHPTSKTAS